MLALTPKLRAATTDAGRQALQSAVTATDQQIGALVYELYGLTEAEKGLVKGKERNCPTRISPLRSRRSFAVIRINLEKNYDQRT